MYLRYSRGLHINVRPWHEKARDPNNVGLPLSQAKSDIEHPNVALFHDKGEKEPPKCSPVT